ncbi:hypothetical protein ILYODFUR_036200 [Ilyodon furcidens]|uniref:Uncharacterized protein n=1 Tax=Ilyodon furcidens TaxID=33524 RepID=A0ABV0UCJ7_9TELE
MQKTHIHSLQENFMDYLFSWLHSGYMAPQTSYERTWLTLHSAPLQDHQPGATSSASKTGLPGPFTYLTHSQSFHPSFSPPRQISKSPHVSNLYQDQQPRIISATYH